MTLEEIETKVMSFNTSKYNQNVKTGIGKTLIKLYRSTSAMTIDIMSFSILIL